MFEWLASPEAWVALATLTALEIVLGIDNIIFISILVGRLPEHQRKFARTVGLGLAMLTRLGLLFSLAWVMGLVEPLFHIFDHPISGRDIILIGGGLFLIAKATHEIHGSLEGAVESERNIAVSGLAMVLVQIAILDIVFSLDSVITQYYETVRPMYQKYLDPQRQYADFIVGEETDIAASILAAKVSELMKAPTKTKKRRS